jgi:hypothetical protein
MENDQISEPVFELFHGDLPETGGNGRKRAVAEGSSSQKKALLCWRFTQTK